jgi:hypothetical protein
MTTSARDRVSIDLRGIGDALRATAIARNTTIAALARAALIDAMNLAPATSTAPNCFGNASAPTVKLTLRLAEPDAERLVHNAVALGLSYGAYVARLVQGTPLPIPAADRAADRAALLVSCDRLAQWAVDLHSLNRLLRAGCINSVLEDLASSNAMALEVRRHLDLASRLLGQPSFSRGALHE